jgi:hypothetical protein
VHEPIGPDLLDVAAALGIDPATAVARLGRRPRRVQPVMKSEAVARICNLRHIGTEEFFALM